MANYDDYQLDEMENSEVNKSKALKRGLAAGAAVLGVGGTAAYGAGRIMNAGEGQETEEVTSEDILAGANAGAEEEAAVQETANTEEVHVVHHHVVTQEESSETVTHEPDLDINESAVLLDEEGEVISTYDAGTVDGKAFVVVDSDLNGRGDVLAYDANGNGHFEDHEITNLDNSSWQMGQGDNLAVYAKNEQGNFDKLWEGQNVNDVHYAHNDDISDIHNDFEDEKTGETYRGDLAENNQDYNNKGGEQYSADMGDIQNDFYDETADKYDGMAYNDGMPYYEEPVDYGYTEPTDDLASYDGSGDGFDDSTVYDA